MKKIGGNIIDLYNRRIFPGEIIFEGDRIKAIQENDFVYTRYILPGFIDAHVHIESSMLTPVEFGRMVIPHGTVAVVSDPHEIANVLGMEGIDFMERNAEKAPVRIFFTVPSCVPSTSLDCSGACLSSHEVGRLLEQYPFVGLSEVMNVPGVLNRDPDLMKKMELVKERSLAIDGHSPLLSGKDLETYIGSGITTDHECSYLDEALEKISLGMEIQIREGSAARNFNALKELIGKYPDRLMFCTDDSHPGDIIRNGHIDHIVRMAVASGYDLFDVLRIACLNPVRHYGLDLGTLRVGDKADFIEVDNLEDFRTWSVFIGGNLMYSVEKGTVSQAGGKEGEECPNLFKRRPIGLESLEKEVVGEGLAIEVYDGLLITGKKRFTLSFPCRNFQSDTEQDILKLVYLNRYEDCPPQIAYIHGLGLKKGAFATSVSHDSHNIIAAGCNDRDLMQAVNAVVATKGGLSVARDGKVMELPLPIAGIMTWNTARETALQWERLTDELHRLGAVVASPFMTLSFMALIVIPELKIGDKGLFEYSRFAFVGNQG